MSSNIPKISVVIPTYNYAHFLKKCLQSVVSQTFVDWEAIVINNFSTDDTVSAVEGFRDKRIRLVNFKNNGIIASSRNKGIELSRSGLIAFLDSDDIWYPEKLHRCVEKIDAGADLVCHSMRYIVNGRHWKDAVCRPRPGSNFLNVLYNQSGIITSTTVVRKKCLLKVGGFDENPDIVTAEDYDLWLKLSKEKFRFCFIEDVLGEYNFHESSFSKKASLHIQAGLNVIDKYSSSPAQALTFYSLKIKRAKASFLYGIARNFQREGNRLEALKFFLKTLIVYPFYLRSYAGMLFTVLPSRFSNFITHDLPAKEWIQAESS